MIAGMRIANALAAAPDTPLVHDGDTWRYGAELDAAVAWLSTELLGRAGLGGRVGVQAWNSAETLVAHLAAERAGLTRVPIDPAAPAPEAAAIREAAALDAIVVDAEHAGSGADEFVLSTKLWEVDAPHTDLVDVEADDTACQIVRSVTTQGLFAIPISYGNWAAHMALAGRLWSSGVYGPVEGPQCYLTVQQMLYGTSMVGTFPFLEAGRPQVILRSFDPSAVLDAAVRFGVTATFMVPGMITRLVEKAPDGLPDWQVHVLYGGAPFPLEEMRSAIRAFGPRFTQLYGRFEGGWPITVLDGEDHARIGAGDDALATSCGRVVDGVDVDLREVGDGRDELRVRSGCVSPSFRDPDGWCSLGDVATIDDHGYLRLHGRVDGMINTGSFHVYPDEVAAAILAAYPAAVAADVRGEPDPRRGQAVAATVDWAAGTVPPSDSEFRSQLAERLAKYKVPRIIRHRVNSQTTTPH
ncbi:MAG: hypothetical protein ABS81_06855 [Pseudonocardia sp. SCN 72-86]|nr:MAG: hypothetical protein ABS81_06855 [Pseudonocardia sp. SCN 72-86]